MVASPRHIGLEALRRLALLTKIMPIPFALSLSKGRSWFDWPVLSQVEGLTTNGVLNVGCSNNSVFILRGARCKRAWGIAIKTALFWRGKSGGLDRTLSIVIAAALLGTMGALIYMVFAQGGGEHFTEFYVLGPDGKAIEYNTELAVGETVITDLTVVNHEGQDMEYRIAVVVNGLVDRDLHTPVLVDEEEWQKEVSFAFQQAGDKQKVEFLLYKNEESAPYGTLLLFYRVGVENEE